MRQVSRHSTLSSLKIQKMKLKTALGLLLFAFLMSSSVMLLNTVAAGEQNTTRIFADPPVLETTGVGESFTVNINVSDVIDLFAWQAGITFNPGVLECTGFFEGEFLRRPGGSTVFAKHAMDMNNTLGIVYCRGCCLLGPVPGVNGSGQLAYVTFTSVGIGVSDFHPTDLILLDDNLGDIPFEAMESFTVPVNGTSYGIVIKDNLTGVANQASAPLSGVFATAFSVNDKKISFDTLATKDWYCQVSVPKELLRCDALSGWTVKVDGVPGSYDATENTTYTALYFRREEGNHTVEISGTEIIGGLPKNLAPPLLIVAVALAGSATLVMAIIDLRKTRSFRKPNQFINKLSP